MVIDGQQRAHRIVKNYVAMESIARCWRPRVPNGDVIVDMVIDLNEYAKLLSSFGYQ